VLLVNLLDFRPPAALSAGITDSALLAGDAGADHVAAMAVVSEAYALAPALTADTYANLVHLRAFRPTRDKPTARPDILQIIAVKLEEASASNGVTWWPLFGSGFVHWLRYTCLDHGGLLSSVILASGC